MPPKVKLTKKEIIDAAVEIIKGEGAHALNARSLASHLSCSTQPIFSNFRTMEEVKEAARARAYELYLDFTRTVLADGEFPPYKAMGMAYIRFAKAESELFKLLFMCDRGEEESGWDDFSDSTVIPTIMQNLGISRESAEKFQLEMWSFVHGIAVMFASSYFTPAETMVSEMLSDAYRGLSYIYKGENTK